MLGCSFTETLYVLPELILVLKVKLTSPDPVCSTTVSSPLLFSMIKTPERPVTVPPILKEVLEEELESSFSAAQPTNNKIKMMEHAVSFQ